MFAVKACILVKKYRDAFNKLAFGYRWRNIHWRVTRKDLVHLRNSRCPVSLHCSPPLLHYTKDSAELEIDLPDRVKL